MSKFRNKKKNVEPKISTASLPDIVFMLLFFFMVTTVIKENELKITVSVPKATEINKLERKSLVSYIYVGKPLLKYQKKYGTESIIQLNDKLSKVDNVVDFIIRERELRIEEERPLMTVSIKADVETKMGIISDIKQELRKIQAYKINYSSKKGED